MKSIIEGGSVKIDSGRSGWHTDYRAAHSHEVVPALVEIISGLQDRIENLERQCEPSYSKDEEMMSQTEDYIAQKWELQVLLDGLYGDGAAAIADQKKALAEGWEPFAVVERFVWFRRAKT